MSAGKTLHPLDKYLEKGVQALPDFALVSIIDWFERGVTGSLTLNFHNGSIGSIEEKRKITSK